MVLENKQLLVAEFVVCLVAWSGVIAAFIGPRLASVAPRRALRAVIAPQMFRIIGITLLAHNIAAPGLDRTFAEWVAIGDAITCGLAIASFFALARPGRLGLVLAAITTVVGAGDLLHNLANGMRVNAAEYLANGWFVVALVVPFMMVMHVMAARLLLKRATWT